MNFVFSIGTASNSSDNQSLDIERVKKTSYFVISSTKENGKYVVNNVTNEVTGIEGVEADAKQSKGDKYYYTLSGQQLTGRPSQRGVYIHAGKKIVVK